MPHVEESMMSYPDELEQMSTAFLTTATATDDVETAMIHAGGGLETMQSEPPLPGRENPVSSDVTLSPPSLPADHGLQEQTRVPQLGQRVPSVTISPPSPQNIRHPSVESGQGPFIVGTVRHSSTPTAVGSSATDSQHGESTTWSTISRTFFPAGPFSRAASGSSSVFSSTLPQFIRHTPFGWASSGGSDDATTTTTGHSGRRVTFEDEVISEYHHAGLASQGGGMLGMMVRGILQTVMHGVVLSLQGLGALMVLGLVGVIMIWERDEEPGLGSWGWKLEMAILAIGCVLIFCLFAIVAHELWVLSAVALLYLQATILVMATGAVMIVWLCCDEQEGTTLSTVFIAGSVFLWSMAVLAFLRAAVVWRVMALEEGDARNRRTRRQRQRYGTFQAF